MPRKTRVREHQRRNAPHVKEHVRVLAPDPREHHLRAGQVSSDPIDQLSMEFERCLREGCSETENGRTYVYRPLSTVDMETAIILNEHDFEKGGGFNDVADGNVYMNAAFQRVFGRSMTSDSDADAHLWNTAWSRTNERLDNTLRNDRTTVDAYHRAADKVQGYSEYRKLAKEYRQAAEALEAQLEANGL